MKAVVEAVKSGTGIRKASKMYAFPTTSLRRRCKGLNKRSIGSAKTLGSFEVNVLGTISPLYLSLNYDYGYCCYAGQILICTNGAS